jgi:hypothetical protein
MTTAVGMEPEAMEITDRTWHKAGNFVDPEEEKDPYGKIPDFDL